MGAGRRRGPQPAPRLAQARAGSGQLSRAPRLAELLPERRSVSARGPGARPPRWGARGGAEGEGEESGLGGRTLGHRTLGHGTLGPGPLGQGARCPLVRRPRAPARASPARVGSPRRDPNRREQRGGGAARRREAFLSLPVRGRRAVRQPCASRSREPPLPPAGLFPSAEGPQLGLRRWAPGVDPRGPREGRGARGRGGPRS